MKNNCCWGGYNMYEECPKGCKEKFLSYVGIKSGDDDMVIARRSSVSMFTNRVLPCVCTNPSTSTILKEGDRLLMLGHTDPLKRNPKQLLRHKSLERLKDIRRKGQNTQLSNYEKTLEIEHFDSIEHIKSPETSSSKYIAKSQPRLHLGVL